MLKKSNKGIVAQHANTLKNKEAPKPVNDYQLIQKMISGVEWLKDVTDFKPMLFLTFPFMKGYHVAYRDKDKNKMITAFVFPTLTLNTLEFLVTAAKNQNLKGQVAFTPNAVFVQEYKP